MKDSEKAAPASVAQAALAARIAEQNAPSQNGKDGAVKSSLFSKDGRNKRFPHLGGVLIKPIYNVEWHVFILG